MKKTMSRRAFLRGAGGVAVALPFLDLMRATPSQAGPTGGPPKRLIIFYTPNGTVIEGPDAWTPSGSGSSFTLSPILQPLQPYQDKLLVLQGVHMNVDDPNVSDGHKHGMGIQLTGMPNNSNNTSSGTSIDQTIGAAVGGSTKFPSYRTAVLTQGEYFGMFYSAPGQYAPPITDPQTVFNDLFSSLTQPSDQLAKIRAQKRSVLDYVSADLKALESRAGAADKQRLDAHASAIRGIEQQLQNGAQVGGSCAVPTISSSLDPNSNDATPALGKAMMDMISMAVACDLSRVLALQWGDMASETVFSWLGQTTGHHTLSHAVLSDTTSQTQLQQINTWYAQQFAYLLGKLAAIPEGNGTALDNTVVLWTNNLHSGQDHSRNDIPYVLAGSCGGYFNTGRFVRFTSGHYVNDLLVSLLNAMGVSATTYGNPAWCAGALPGLAV